MPSIDEIFESASWLPQLKDDSEVELARVENRLGRHLPAEFRRLYALENGLALMAKFSNGDSPIELNQLGLPSKDYGWADPLGDGLLPFMIENQQVCAWAIDLNHKDDPSVLVNCDDGPARRWRLCSERFTCWLDCQIRDSLLLKSCTFTAIGPALGVDKLPWLREQFKEEDKTYGWPGRVNYRFSNARSRLLLWDSDGQCDWWVALNRGDDAEALDEIQKIAGDDVDFKFVEKAAAQ